MLKEVPNLLRILFLLTILLLFSPAVAKLITYHWYNYKFILKYLVGAPQQKIPKPKDWVNSQPTISVSGVMKEPRNDGRLVRFVLSSINNIIIHIFQFSFINISSCAVLFKTWGEDPCKGSRKEYSSSQNQGGINILLFWVSEFGSGLYFLFSFCLF